MSLTNFTSTITAATLRANFDDKTTTLATNAVAGQKDWFIFDRHTSFTDTTNVGVRTRTFTLQDDAEVRLLHLRNTDTTAGRVITVTLSVYGGDTDYLARNTISLSLTTINGTVDSRTDYRTTTGTRFRLKKGVRYMVVVANANAGTTTGVTQWSIGLRSIRRAT